MRRILALDTSTWWGSVALVEGGGSGQAPRVVAEAGERIDGSHAERLLDWVAQLLADAGWAKTSLDAYAATCGPGSFTGIRVGLGTVRGLGLAADRPCLGVTTLEAIAEAHGPAETARHPVMDAGRGELYTARYDAGGSPPEEREAPWLGPAAEVLARAAADGGTVVAGPGTELAWPSGGEGAGFRSPLRLAGAAGRIATFRTGAPAPLAPLYIRPPDALLKKRPGT